MSDDHYQILGVSRTATSEDIQKSYREMARKYHPDLHPDDDAAKEQFKKEFSKLQAERVSAFKEFHDDTVNQKFNDPKITVGIDDKEYDNFLKLAEKY